MYIKQIKGGYLQLQSVMLVINSKNGSVTKVKLQKRNDASKKSVKKSLKGKTIVMGDNFNELFNLLQSSLKK
jgi:hypothetical protein